MRATKPIWPDANRIGATAYSPADLQIRIRAQSLMTRDGNVCPLPTLEEANAILNDPDQMKCSPGALEAVAYTEGMTA